MPPEEHLMFTLGDPLTLKFVYYLFYVMYRKLFVFCFVTATI